MSHRLCAFVSICLLTVLAGPTGLALRADPAGPIGPALRAAYAQGPSGQGLSPNAVVPGELVIEPPTLINLGFEWFIQGDVNRNASVEVAFRKKGDTMWRTALPLLRLQGERIYAE